MCKIFAMTNMAKVKVTHDFIGIVRDAVCRLSDRDGFGYALNTVSGEIWGEKTIHPFSFEALLANYGSKTCDLPIVERKSVKFGPVGEENNCAFIGHGRLSTNVVTHEATHPFLNDEIALIHNGVVNDAFGVAGNLVTGCDTEILLKLWESGGIQGIEENASGYYAIAILDKLGQLHIARDRVASLYIAYSETVNSYLIATTPEIIQSIAKGMGWTVENCEKVIDDMYAVFKGNEVVTHFRIEPLGFETNSQYNPLVQRALGSTDAQYISDDEKWYNETRGEGYREELEEIPVDYEENLGQLTDDDGPTYSDDDNISSQDVVEMIKRRQVN